MSINSESLGFKRRSQRRYPSDIKERAAELMRIYANRTVVGRILGVPESTLRGWLKSIQYDENTPKVSLDEGYASGYSSSAYSIDVKNPYNTDIDQQGITQRKRSNSMEIIEVNSPCNTDIDEQKISRRRRSSQDLEDPILKTNENTILSPNWYKEMNKYLRNDGQKPDDLRKQQQVSIHPMDSLDSVSLNPVGSQQRILQDLHLNYFMLTSRLYLHQQLLQKTQGIPYSGTDLEMRPLLQNGVQQQNQKSDEEVQSLLRELLNQKKDRVECKQPKKRRKLMPEGNSNNIEEIEELTRCFSSCSYGNEEQRDQRKVINDDTFLLSDYLLLRQHIIGEEIAEGLHE